MNNLLIKYMQNKSFHDKTATIYKKKTKTR